jgi:hypothetical protein
MAPRRKHPGGFQYRERLHRGLALPTGVAGPFLPESFEREVFRSLEGYSLFAPPFQYFLKVKVSFPKDAGHVPEEQVFGYLTLDKT